jgi:hypothetical protein
MLAISENKEIQNFIVESISIPKARPGFSIKVILKKSPITGIFCPIYIPSCLIFRKGMWKPLIQNLEA